MDKKNLLFLLHIPPPIHGSSMVGEQIKNSVLLNNHFNIHYINLLASNNVSESGKFTFQKFYNFLLIFYKLFNSLVFKRPDFCYFALSTTGIAFYKDFIFIFLIKIFRKKIVYHLHNKGVREFVKKNKINKYLYKYIFKNDKVILLSHLLYNDISEFVKEDKILICPNGIPDNFKIKNNYNNEIPVILFVSNLIKSKGVFDLLSACEILKKRSIKFKCKIIWNEGDIDKSSLLNHIYSLNIHDYVEYLGPKYGNDKYFFYNTSDIFVLPTFYKNECLPIVLIEAMQFSLPVISTFEGGIPDLIIDNKNGFLIKQNEIIALADRIEFLINYPKVSIEMGIEGRKHFLNYYTDKHFEYNLFNILINL